LLTEIASSITYYNPTDNMCKGIDKRPHQIEAALISEIGVGYPIFIHRGFHKTPVQTVVCRNVLIAVSIPSPVEIRARTYSGHASRRPRSGFPETLWPRCIAGVCAAAYGKSRQYRYPAGRFQVHWMMRNKKFRGWMF
jgi:hypothetical protein